MNSSVMATLMPTALLVIVSSISRQCNEIFFQRNISGSRRLFFRQYPPRKGQQPRINLQARVPGSPQVDCKLNGVSRVGELQHSAGSQEAGIVANGQHLLGL